MTHSARFLFAALCSAAVLVSVGGANAQQSPAAVPPSKALTPQQYDEFLTARLLSTTAQSVHTRKSISDAELTVLSDIIHKPSLPVSLKASALKPLSDIDPMSVTPAQKEKLNTLLGEVLRASDTTTDASGSMKLYALAAVQHVPGNKLAPDIRALQDDTRDPVRTMVRRMMGKKGK